MKRWVANAVLGLVLSETGSHASAASTGTGARFAISAEIPPPPPRPKTVTIEAVGSDQKVPEAKNSIGERHKQRMDGQRLDPPGHFSVGDARIQPVVLDGRREHNADLPMFVSVPPVPNRRPSSSKPPSLGSIPTDDKEVPGFGPGRSLIVKPTDKTGDNNHASRSSVVGVSKDTSDDSPKASENSVMLSPFSQSLSHRASLVQSGTTALPQQPPPPQQKLQPGTPPRKTDEGIQADVERSIQEPVIPQKNWSFALDKSIEAPLTRDEQKRPPPPIWSTKKNTDAIPSSTDSLVCLKWTRQGSEKIQGSNKNKDKPAPLGASIKETLDPTIEESDYYNGARTHTSITPKLGRNPFDWNPPDMLPENRGDSVKSQELSLSVEEKDRQSTLHEAEKPFTFKETKESQTKSQESNCEGVRYSDDKLVEENFNRLAPPSLSKLDPPEHRRTPGRERHNYRHQADSVLRPALPLGQTLANTDVRAAKHGKDEPLILFRRGKDDTGDENFGSFQAQNHVAGHDKDEANKSETLLSKQKLPGNEEEEEKQPQPEIQLPSILQEQKAQPDQLKNASVAQGLPNQTYQPYYVNRHPSQTTSRPLNGVPPQSAQPQQEPPSRDPNQTEQQQQQPPNQESIPLKQLPPPGGLVQKHQQQPPRQRQLPHQLQLSTQGGLVHRQPLPQGGLQQQQRGLPQQEIPLKRGLPQQQLPGIRQKQLSPLEGIRQQHIPQPEDIRQQHIPPLERKQQFPPQGGLPQQTFPSQGGLPNQSLVPHGVLSQQHLAPRALQQHLAPPGGPPQQQQQQQLLPQQQQGRLPQQTQQQRHPAQQARRGPRPQFRQPPLQKLVQKKAPAWKRLLRKVEGTLDTLADLEEVVTGRTKRLVATASSAIKVPINTGKAKENTNDNEDSDFEPETSVPTFKPPIQRQRVPQRPPPVNPSLTNPENILARHVSMRQQQERQQQTPDSSGRKNDWNGVVSGKSGNRLVVANGGAAPAPGSNNENISSPYQQGPPLSNAPPYRPAHAPPAPAKPVAKDSEHRREVRALLGKQPGIQQVDRPRGGLTSSVGTSENQRPKPARRPSLDENELSWKEKLGRFIPPIPIFNPFRWGDDSFEYASTLDAWDAEDGETGSRGFLGFWRRKKASGSIKKIGASTRKNIPPVTPIISALMERCEQQETRTLLQAFERKKCVFLGIQRAIFDLTALFFLLYASREIAYIDPKAVAHSSKNVAEAVLRIVQQLTDGWFHFAVVGAFLSFITNALLLELASQTLSKRIGSQVLREAEYGSLFLRLVLSASTKRSVVEEVQATSQAQALATVESARLTTFVGYLLGSLVLMTLSFIKPMLLAIVNTATDITSIPEWHAWPIQWKPLLGVIRNILVDFFHFARSALTLEFQSLLRQPFRLAYNASLCLVLFLVSRIPKWEMNRSVQSLAQSEDGTSLESRLNQASKVSNLGISSATRLQLLSKKSALDEILERWRTTTSTQTSGQVEEEKSLRSLLHQISFGLASGLLLSLPIFVYARVGITGDHSQNEHWVEWDSLLEVGFILVYTQMLFLSTISRALDVSGAKKWIVRFQSNFVSAVKERTKQLTAPPANLQLQASISPAAGIVVRDLWAAHSTRRAWGVRGASLTCRSGEVLVILGDDGAGKSRLLTTIAEAILVPPKQAQTVARVRGSVLVGGLDVSKWDPNQLRKRVGLMLNDVRTVADLSQALSGLTIEEILEPIDGMRTFEAQHTLGSDAKTCMIVALKITGLYSTLLPRLPAKLSTAVTGNEEDLNPSPLRPHFTILSPAEWLKLLLARVICQSIFDNENAAATHDKVEKSMIGSLLLLDDVMAHFSDADEGRLMRELRSSSAATVLTSNRWALGRWADRIVVLKDGAVIETGTHNELLNRGPQQSLYAAKWHIMTSA